MKQKILSAKAKKELKNINHLLNMRKKLTVSLDEDLIKELERIRTTKESYEKTILDKSHFTETILTIGLTKYKQQKQFFDKINLHNIDLSKINF
jgi:hypothetical protein